MGIGTCFIIVECNFKEDIVKEVKSLAMEYDFSPIIAEEIPSFNVDLLDHKVLKPMENSDFVIVLLSPKGKDKRDANFNVAFEFGYARGIPKPVILLFDGDSKDLPTDINRDHAIFLSNIKWKDELTNLIQKQIEEKEVGLVKLPDKLVGYLAEGITHDKFDVFQF